MPLLDQILASRNITSESDVDSFFAPALGSMHDPFLMKNMKTACDRIVAGIRNNEKIVVYGDYDVDGVAASSILYSFFDEIGFHVDVYIPDRDSEGYGLNESALRKIAEKSDLLITVDNGISALKEAELAKEIGLDLIITDHHLPPDEGLPSALAILNPKQEGCGYPFKDLCGAGIAFKLAVAIRKTLAENGVERKNLPNLGRYLDLTAVATVADSVSLTGENRIIVCHGLKVINNTGRAGLAQLAKRAVYGGAKISSRDIAFGIAPRINAAGRMGSARDAFELLVSNDKRRSTELANRLEQLNEQRKEIQREMEQEAEALVKTDCDIKKDSLIVVGKEGWQPGIIGIVASRLCDNHGVPAIVVAFNDSVGRGSARGVEGRNVDRILAGAAEYLTSYGGHKMAGGLSFHQNDFDKVKKSLIKSSLEETGQNGEKPALHIDALYDPSGIDINMAKEISKLEPFGTGNEPPKLLIKSARIRNIEKIGKNDNSRRLTIDAGVKIIAFNSARFIDRLDETKYKYDIVYSPALDRFRGKEQVALSLVDIKASV